MLLTAIAMVIGHSVFPHLHHNEDSVLSHQQHHDGPAPGKHQHDDEENSDGKQHDVLAFAQMDDSFIPAKRLIRNFEFPVEFIPGLISTILSDNFSVKTKADFGWYKEYPPPNCHFHIPSLRGPPVA